MRLLEHIKEFIKFPGYKFQKKSTILVDQQHSGVKKVTNLIHSNYENFKHACINLTKDVKYNEIIKS